MRTITRKQIQDTVTKTQYTSIELFTPDGMFYYVLTALKE
jgi:hypothetical protein